VAIAAIAQNSSSIIHDSPPPTVHTTEYSGDSLDFSLFCDYLIAIPLLVVLITILRKTNTVLTLAYNILPGPN
jgi:hypothetical protein